MAEAEWFRGAQLLGGMGALSYMALLLQSCHKVR